MTEADILDRITAIVREALDDDTIVLTPESRADEFPEWDSFMHITIVVATELRFGVKFKTAEIESLKNVGSLIALIQGKLGS